VRQLPCGREAGSGVGASAYTRHRPERTLLYQLVREYSPALKAHRAAQGAVLPGYVEQEFEGAIVSPLGGEAYPDGKRVRNVRDEAKRSRIVAGLLRLVFETSFHSVLFCLNTKQLNQLPQILTRILPYFWNSPSFVSYFLLLSTLWNRFRVDRIIAYTKWDAGRADANCARSEDVKIFLRKNIKKQANSDGIPTGAQYLQ
jgi:hypothetical protein